MFFGSCVRTFCTYFRLMDTMVNTVGQRIGERALKLGELFLPDEALEIGLVDEVVPDSEVLESARREMKKYLNVPGK